MTFDEPQVVTIEHGNCECLYRDMLKHICYKRTFKAYDVINQKVLNIKICNELFRLLIHNTSIEYCYDTYLPKVHAIKVAEKIIREYISDSYGEVSYTLCNRPFIGGGISLLNAISVIKTGNYSIIYETGIADGLYIHLELMCENLLKYKKYKHTHNTCERILKKINNNRCLIGVDKELNTLLLELLNLKIFEKNQKQLAL
jgi:hypothetical protein